MKRGERMRQETHFHPVLLSVKVEKKGIMTVATLFLFTGCTVPFLSLDYYYHYI